MKLSNTSATASSGSSYVTSEVEVSSNAIGGTGTSVDPWTGWDTAITWSEFTRYRFKSGYYRYVTSPNFLKKGIELIGEPGTYFVHAPTTAGTDAFVMDAGSTPGTTWIQNVRVENIIVYGSPTTVTGTISVSSGGTTLTGTGTSFLSQLPVGSYITFLPGTSSAHSYKISAVASNTSATIDNPAAIAYNSTGAKVCLTRNGFFLRGVRNGVFEQLAAHDIGNAGIWTEGCVTNSLRMFRCTYHEPVQATEFLSRPQYGIVTAGRGADWSTTWHIEEPVIEGMMVAGILFKPDSYGNTLINGTSEGNPYNSVGLLVQSSHHTIIGIDIESNTSGVDLKVNGSFNTFINCICQGAVSVVDDATLSPVGNAAKNTFIGMMAGSITIATNVYMNRIISGEFTTFTDSGNDTIKLPTSGATNYRTFIGVPRRSSVSDTTVDCSLANRCSMSAFGAVTISNPTNATNGDSIRYVINNSSGSTQNITWGSNFQGSILPATIATGKSIVVDVEFTSYWGKWNAVSVSTSP